MANTTTADEGTPLTGKKVLMIFLGFFAIVFAMNGVLMYDAISTFRGQVADHPYEAGIKFNAEIKAAAAQNERKWMVDVNLRDGVQAVFRDAQGQPVQGLTVSANFAALADRKLDHAFALNETSPGIYSATGQAPSGIYELELAAKRGGETLFQSRNRVTR